MIRKMAFALLLLVFGSLAARAGDFNGKWTAEFDTQIGHLKYTFEFHVDGSKLTGMATSNMHGSAEIQDGKIDGDKITFVEVVKGNEDDIRVVYTGKIDGDVINLTRQFSGYHTEEIVAKRVK